MTCLFVVCIHMSFNVHFMSWWNSNVLLVTINGHVHCIYNVIYNVYVHVHVYDGDIQCTCMYIYKCTCTLYM